MIQSVGTNRWRQESYETGDPAIRLRTRQLRALGFAVRTESMGRQITNVGELKVTLVDIRPGDNEDLFELPPPPHSAAEVF